MAVTNTFTNGTTADADEVNQNFTDTTVHRKVFTLAGPVTHTGDTNQTDVAGGSFTITNGLNALILGIYFRCALAGTGGALAGANLKLSGTNLGDVFLTTNSGNVYLFNDTLDRDSVGVRRSTSEGNLFEINIGTTQMSTMVFFPLKLLDETTTFQLRQQIGNSSETVTISDVEVEVVYVKTFTDD